MKHYNKHAAPLMDLSAPWVSFETSVWMDWYHVWQTANILPNCRCLWKVTCTFIETWLFILSLSIEFNTCYTFSHLYMVPPGVTYWYVFIYTVNGIKPKKWIIDRVWHGKQQKHRSYHSLSQSNGQYDIRFTKKQEDYMSKHCWLHRSGRSLGSLIRHEYLIWKHYI